MPSLVSEGKISDEGKCDSPLPEEFGRHRRYYTASEVSLHNCASDCWVSIFGSVYDVTPLLNQVTSENDPETLELIVPIIKHAGKDISDWFDPETRQVLSQVDERTGLLFPLLPHGRFLHVAPLEPVSNWRTDFEEPWWRDERYCIGKLSKSVRTIVVLNMLTYAETRLQVCEEETLEEIEVRYEDWNAHSKSYVWKVLDEDHFRTLDMKKTLTENGVVDETKLFEKLSIDPETYVPTIHVYFKDDLTEA